MIFEKEDKYLETDQKLKEEDQQLLDLEQEVRAMELRLKEKNQESNLLDFKLRDMARHNETEVGFLKPHSGIHSGLLSGAAALPLAPAISLTNNRHLRGMNTVVSQSHDIHSYRQQSRQSRQSRRPTSRYSMASHVSRLDQDTISMSKKRRLAPEVASIRYDN